MPRTQPSAASRVSSTGSSAAVNARSQAINPMPVTASPMPMSCRPLTRSPSSIAPSSTVNGADACGTSDASPLGIHRARRPRRTTVDQRDPRLHDRRRVAPLGAIAGIQPHILQRINNFQVTAALVHAGLGVVLLPRHSVPAAELVRRPLAEVYPARMIDDVTRAAASHRPAAEVLAALQQEAQLLAGAPSSVPQRGTLLR